MSPSVPDVEVTIPPRPEFVGVVRHVMGAVARLGQHSPEFVENAKLAGSEAVTNAVALSGRAGTDQPVEVRAMLDDDRLEIEVADRGAGAKEQFADMGDTTDTPAGGFESGLSLPLLEGLVDELAIDPRDGGGNVVRMALIRELDEEGPD
ncbi:MAG: ATP-binding protein [Actinomycetota bacterium]